MARTSGIIADQYLTAASFAGNLINFSCGFRRRGEETQLKLIKRGRSRSTGLNAVIHLWPSGRNRTEDRHRREDKTRGSVAEEV